MVDFRDGRFGSGKANRPVPPPIRLRFTDIELSPGARRLREAIFGILPPWFVEEAKELCAKTLADGGGKPLAQRVADAIKRFEDLGITADQIEQKLGRPSSKWTEHDVAQLVVTYKSLQRGEITRDEEFPPVRVTAAEIAGTPAKPTTDGPA